MRAEASYEIVTGAVSESVGGSDSQGSSSPIQRVPNEGARAPFASPSSGGNVRLASRESPEKTVGEEPSAPIGNPNLDSGAHQLPVVQAEPPPSLERKAFEEALRSYHQGHHDTALKQLTGLAKIKHGPAMYNLGMMHELGLGVTADIKKARGWYLRAARYAKNIDAMQSLGLLYQHGEREIGPSGEKALFWFRLAAKLKSTESEPDYG